VRAALAGLLVFCCSARTLPAENILFIGNSFTYGGGDGAVLTYGGVPKLVEAIAASKGKAASTRMVTTGGKDWGFHLGNPATDAALQGKPWDGVVLQDYSTKPTHAGNVDEFMKNGRLFYDRIARESPHAQIVLYETWAYDSRHAIFAAAPSPKQFANPDEMTGELDKNYEALGDALRALDPHRQVLVARVGMAFARCVRENPDINLYATDFKHPDRQGSYLAALVIYATLFHDSSRGATGTFPGFTLDAAEAGKLQSVAQEVCPETTP